MAHESGRDLVDVWVVYHVRSGSVTRVMFQEPTVKETPKPRSGYVLLRTKISEWARAHIHQLRVEGGKVVHGPALVGI